MVEGGKTGAVEWEWGVRPDPSEDPLEPVDDYDDEEEQDYGRPPISPFTHPTLPLASPSLT